MKRRRWVLLAVLAACAALGTWFLDTDASRTSAPSPVSAVREDGPGRGGEPLSQGVIANGPTLPASPAPGTDVPEEASERSEPEEACWLTGRVLDEDGRALARVSLHLDINDLMEADSFEAVSQEDGSYHLGPARCARRCALIADAQGYQHRYLAVPLLMPDTPPVEVVLHQASLIEGKVVDESGRPIPQVSVSVLANWDDAELGFESVISDEEGAFQLDVPEPANYTLSLQHSSFLSTEQSITAPAQRALFVLRSGLTLEIEVVDESGRPLEGASVTTLLNGAGELPALRYTLPTDSKGRVTMQGLEPGAYEVMAGAMVGGHPRTVTRRVVASRAEVRQVRLQLEAGGGLSGQVVDEAGRGVEGAELRVIPAALVTPAPEDQAEPLSLQFLREAWQGDARGGARTGTDGRFTLEHLGPGPHVVTAHKPGYRLAEGSANTLTVEGVTGIRLPAGVDEVRLVLKFEGQVRGRVVHEDGSPVTSFRIDDKPQEDARGVFLWPITQPGRQVLTFHAEGLAKTWREVDVRQGEFRDVGDVVLHPGRHVSVLVLDAETSMPVRGATLEPWLLGQDTPLAPPPRPLPPGAIRLKDDPENGVMTDMDGGGVLSFLDAQPMTLEVRHPDYIRVRTVLGAWQRSVLVRMHGHAAGPQ